MTTISNMRIARNAMCLILLAGTTACAGSQQPSYPVPDEPGIYAFTENDQGLNRLDGDADWETATWSDRSNMPSNVQFVVYDPSLAGRAAGSSVELWRVPWVRSEIDANGQILPVQGSQWAVAPIEPYSVPFRYESPPGQTEIVHIVPAVPLEPGLYTLRLVNPGARQARIGVDWNNIDHRQYSAANCVDRYEGSVYRPCSAEAAQAMPAPSDLNAAGVTANGGLASLSAPAPAAVVAPAPAPVPAPTPAPAVAQPAMPTPAPAPAVAQPATPAPAPAMAPQVAAAPSAEDLQIALVDPVRRNDGLLIQGVVMNTGSQVRTIPMMQGSLENSAGQEVRRWEFQPPVQTLQPGARADFKTEVHPIPPGVTRASVAFLAQ